MYDVKLSLGNKSYSLFILDKYDSFRSEG